MLAPFMFTQTLNSGRVELAKLTQGSNKWASWLKQFVDSMYTYLPVPDVWSPLGPVLLVGVVPLWVRQSMLSTDPFGALVNPPPKAHTVVAQLFVVAQLVKLSKFCTYGSTAGVPDETTEKTFFTVSL